MDWLIGGGGALQGRRTTGLGLVSELRWYLLCGAPGGRARIRSRWQFTRKRTTPSTMALKMKRMKKNSVKGHERQMGGGYGHVLLDCCVGR
jgi:hypothetical protein